MANSAFPHYQFSKVVELIYTVTNNCTIVLHFLGNASCLPFKVLLVFHLKKILPNSKVMEIVFYFIFYQIYCFIFHIKMYNVLGIDIYTHGELRGQGHSIWTSNWPSTIY